MITKSQAKTVLDLISRFIPKSNYKKAKHTNGGKFKIASTGEQYSGYYIEDSRGNFIAGRTPEERGPELESIEPQVNISRDLIGGVKLKVVQRGLTQRELAEGVIVRYFTQDLHNLNISEVPLDTYNRDKTDTLRKRVIQTNWVIKGPAEDKMFGKYPYQGSESRNKQAIQSLEKDMPGISTYVQDYRYLVQEPSVATNAGDLATGGLAQTGTGALTGTVTGTGAQTGTTVRQEAELTPEQSLENSRKANFDTRK